MKKVPSKPLTRAQLAELKALAALPDRRRPRSDSIAAVPQSKAQMARVVFPFVRSFLLTAPISLPPQNLSPGAKFRAATQREVANLKWPARESFRS
jgi:hypothetical protein